ncbi:MAG: hypothetical protein IPK20_25675 [Betaproteobacteria bacterium]|nr:hypothetical protein [Betaproteobacteria bacterium]
MSVARTLSAPSYRIHYGIPFVYGLAETGALNEAREVLEEQRRAIAGTALTCFDPLLLAVEARIEELDGNVDRSIVLVRAMWRCAVSTGHGDYLHWVKPWVVRFADLALREDVETTYVVRLIHRHGWQAGPGCSECWPWPVKIHALGRFTLRVGGEVPRHGRKAPRRPWNSCVC